jgi:vacuolar protein sorting-associated protein IST1
MIAYVEFTTLSQPPSAFLVVNYLKEIARQFNVEWEPSDLGLASDDLAMQVTPTPTGFSVPMAPGYVIVIAV